MEVGIPRFHRTMVSSDRTSLQNWWNIIIFSFSFCAIIVLKCLFVFLHINKFYQRLIVTFEQPHDKTNKVECPPSLIRVFAVRTKKAWVLNYPLSAQRRLWSDWANAQADLSLRWAHMPFYWFCHEEAHLFSAPVPDLPQRRIRIQVH